MRRRLASLFLASLLAACGKVGPPVPPEDRLPQPVADLRAIVETGAVELTWTNPSRRVDNTRLRDLAAARVYRTVDGGSGEPRPALVSRGRVAGWDDLAKVPLAPPPSPSPEGPVVQDHRVRLEDQRGLAYGQRYTYVVLTEDAEGRVSPPSPRVSVTFIAAPESPPGLTAVPGEREVRLAWQPPARLVDGADVSGPLRYEVLRGPEGAPPVDVVTKTPVETRTFVDRDLENDRTYHYAVRALRQEGGTLARGSTSPPVAATPRDMTPPAPPAALVAAPAPEGVRLSWRPSPDADVGTYVVYRALPGASFVRVGSTSAPSTVFVDRGVARGTYRYAVTAQDRGARPNESARSNEVTVSVP